MIRAIGGHISQGFRNMSSSPLGVLVLVGFLILTIVSSGAGTLAQVTPPSEASYEFGFRDAWKGAVKFSGGQRDSTQFITSWTQEGLSEAITFQGSLELMKHLALDVGPEYEYRIKVNTGSGWEDYQTISKKVTGVTSLSKGAVVSLEAETIHLKGTMKGAIAVELWVKAKTNPFGGVDTQRAAVDGAKLVDGTGSMKFSKDRDLYKNGETVKLNVRTGEGPWYLTVFDARGQVHCPADTRHTASLLSLLSTFQGPVGLGSDPNVYFELGENRPTPQSCLQWHGQRATTVAFTIPEDAYDPATNNTWQIILQNNLIDQAQLKTFVIDQFEKTPETPNQTTLDEQGNIVTDPVDVGKPLTAHFESRANPSGGPVSKFVVYIWHGDKENAAMPPEGSHLWIANGVEVPAQHAGENVYTGTYEYRPKMKAHIHSWGVAFDTSNRPSGTHLDDEVLDRQSEGTDGTDTDGDGTVDVCEGGLAPNPDGSCGIPDGNDDGRVIIIVQGAEPVGYAEPETTTSGLVLLLVLLVGILGAVVAWTYIPGPSPIKAGVVGTGLLLLAWFGGLFG